MQVQYGSTDAEVYDRVIDSPELTAFSVGQLAPLVRGRSAVDLGCGTGRVTLGLAPYAAHIWAIDNSAAMLEKLTAKGVPDNVTPAEADFLSLRRVIPRAPDVVYCTLGSLSCCADDDELQDALGAVAEACPGAQFWYEFYGRAAFCDVVEQQGESIETPLPSGGSMVTTYTLSDDRLTMSVKCEARGSEGDLVGRMSEHVLVHSPEDIRRLAELSGHEVADVQELGAMIVVRGHVR